MKKIIGYLVVVLIASCANNKTAKITAQLEQDLCMNAYLDTPKYVNGYTVQTFIDSNIQLAANEALLASIVPNKADYGFVIVMETQTGRIKALVNLEKNSDNNYTNAKNWFINEPVLPGGLIKTFDLMSLLEDKKADTTSIYDAQGGQVVYAGKTIYDAHLGHHKLSLANAFIYASNSIFAQAIDSAYGNEPILFCNNLEKFGLEINLQLPISSTTNENNIPNPKSKNWTNTSLPWMAIGYEHKISPINLLTYYNAIANNGVMVQPLFMSNIKNKSGETKAYSTLILNEAICSNNSIKKIQDVLRKVVTDGTGKPLLSDEIPISGKSATIQINADSLTQYASTFVGYFPTNKPKYTVLVYVYNPQVEFYGSTVAGSVLKSIALSHSWRK